MKKRLVKAIGILLTSVMVATSFNISVFATDSEDYVVENAVDYGLENPRVDEKSLITTYDCIYFGNYYQDKYIPTAIPKSPVDKGVYIDADGKTKFECVEINHYDTTINDYVHDGYEYFTYQPILWRVLEVNGDEAFIISDKIIDAHSYITDNLNQKWENSSIRSWLNGYTGDKNTLNIDYSIDPEESFIGKAFSSEERNAILVSNIDNKGFETTIYPESAIDSEGNKDTSKGETSFWGSGDNTNDYVYLLSWDESINTKYGFSNATTENKTELGSSNGKLYEFHEDADEDDARCSVATDFASARGTYKDGHYYDDLSSWWIRTIGDCYYAGYVSSKGMVYHCGVDYESLEGVRPVLHIDLTKNVWEKADVMTSDLEKELPKKHWITLDANGGKFSTGKEFESLYLTENKIYGTLPKPENENGCFLGWYTEKDGGNKIEGNTKVQSTDTRLYAHWAEGHGDTVSKNKVAPTCGKNGYTGDSYCSVCDKLIEKGTSQPATGNHNYVDNDKKPATCTEDGVEGGKHCLVCGAQTGDIKTIKATGHTLDEGVVITKPTYEKEGEKECTCLVCKAVVKQAVSKLLPVENIVKVKNEEYKLLFEARDLDKNPLPEVNLKDIAKGKGGKVTFAKAKNMKLTGYTFKGFYVDGRKKSSLKAKDLKDGMTIVATYTENTYNIVYKVDKPAKRSKVEGKISSVKAKYSEEVTLDGGTFTSDGYKIIGWSTKKKASEPEYQLGEKVKGLTEKNKGKVVLYPVWAAMSYINDDK